jgi:hypothetical protein
MEIGMLRESVSKCKLMSEETPTYYPKIVATWFTKSSIAFGFLIKHFLSSSSGNDSLNS